MASIFDDIETDGHYKALSKADIKARMLKLVPQAFRTLESNLYSEDDKVSTMAALGILDRCGYGVHSKITLEDDREDLTSLTEAQLRDRALAVAKQLEQKPSNYDVPFDDSEDSRSVH
jgi:rRNA maturation endonuclease Nob1